MLIRRTMLRMDCNLPPRALRFFGLVVSNASLNVCNYSRKFPMRFFSVIFFIVPKLHHNAAVPKLGFCKLRVEKDLVGVSGFEPEASCAQGGRANGLSVAGVCISPVW